MIMSKNKQENLFFTFLEVIRPTGLESIFFIIAGLFSAFSSELVPFLQKSPTIAYDAAIVKRVAVNLLKFIDGGRSSPLLSTAFVWFVVGGFVYIMGWILLVIIIDIYNDLVVSYAFIHPNSFQQSKYWTAIIGRVILRVTAAAMLLIGLILSVTEFMPYLYAKSTNTWMGANFAAKASSIFLIIFLVFLALQFAVIMLRLSFLKKRLF